MASVMVSDAVCASVCLVVYLTIYIYSLYSGFSAKEILILPDLNKGFITNPDSILGEEVEVMEGYN